jgi:nucleoside-diphosphate-sugar epimerase
MKILVTGAAGFIGTHLCRELTASGHQVEGVDLGFPVGGRDIWSSKSHRDIRYHGVKLDLNKGTDAVIHLAAKVGRLFGEDDVQNTIADNAAMTTRVAKECGEAGVRLMYASTSEVYGDWADEYVDEDQPFTRIPHNIYGLSKRWGEEACQLYAPDRLTIMRFSMPYGPGLPAGRGRAALINFLYNALHGELVTVHRGSERSWCWIGDTVRAARMLLERTDGGAFNIGRDDNALPMRTVAEMACDLVGAPHNLIVEVDPPERQTVVKRLSTDRIRSLGWEPHVDLEEGMARTLEWVKTLGSPRVLAA